MRTKNIFTSTISVGGYNQFIDEIVSYGRSKIPSYVCFANVHMVVEAHMDKSFQNVVNEANVVAPDGRPLSLFLRLSEGIKQDRVCGMDVMPDLLKRAEVVGESIYFYGGTEEVLNAVIQKAKVEFPELRIAGHYAPPFRALSKEEDDRIVQAIRDAHPDLVFVSLGCPKQERWMAEHKPRLNACLLGLGQAFRVYAGVEKRLPPWMRNLSLEWAYRLIQEPGRLWKRYLYTNSVFLFLAMRCLVVQLFQRQQHRLGL